MPYYEGADVNDRSWVQMIIRVQLSVLKVMKLTMANHIPLRSKNVAIIKLCLSLSQRLCIWIKINTDTSCINSWVTSTISNKQRIIINMTRLIPHPFADKSAYQETRSSTNDARRRLPYTERRKMLLLYVVIQSVLYPSQVFMYPTKYCVPARPALLTSAHSTQHRSMADGQCI